MTSSSVLKAALAFLLVFGAVLIWRAPRLEAPAAMPAASDAAVAADALQSAESAQSQPVLDFGSVALMLEIADTPSERIQGLSGREGLPDGTGLFFVFEEPGRHGIWMKDMLFPIDILWLGGNLEILHIEHSVSPDTYPEVFEPNVRAFYVLEVPAGFAADNGIAVGTQAKLR